MSTLAPCTEAAFNAAVNAHPAPLKRCEQVAGDEVLVGYFAGDTLIAGYWLDRASYRASRFAIRAQGAP